MQPYMDMHVPSLVQCTKPTVILKNDLVLLKLTFIFIRGCKWIFGVAAAVTFTGKSVASEMVGMDISQPTRLYDFAYLDIRCVMNKIKCDF